jgi:hypothetical protein
LKNLNLKNLTSMKKLAILIAVVVASASVSTVSAQEHKWGVGARVGTGFEAVAEYHLSDKNYLEGRFGMDYVGGLMADFSVLYNWRVFTPDWTPGQGTWFFDAGVGLRLGGAAHIARIGVQGQAKLGYTFEGVPLSLAFDFSPSFGPVIGYGFRDWDGSRLGSVAIFDQWAICSLGLSCVYHF